MKILLFITMCFTSACTQVETFESDYITTHGVSVHLDEELLSGPEEVELWTQEALVFWDKHKPKWKECSRRATARTKVVFRAECPVVDVCDSGIDTDKQVALGCSSLNGRIDVGSCVRDWAYKHELSHIIALDCDGLWWDAHDLFDSFNMDSHFKALSESP